MRFSSSLDWQTGGSTTLTGLCANTLSILGQATTGDARQYSPVTTLWGAVRDTSKEFLV